MKILTAALITHSLFSAAAGAAEYQLDSAGAPPEAVPAAIKPLLAEDGHRISGGDGALCEVWLVKAPSVKPGFAPDLRVKYPFEIGTLVGVLRVGKDEELTDFRDQVILPGLYTLRYAHQPQDGNHIGTSEQADFLLAVPAEEDRAAAKLGDKDRLNSLSADAAGSSHPALFPLLPPAGEKPEQATLSHQQDRDLWILQTTGDEKRPPLRLVIIGHAQE